MGKRTEVAVVLELLARKRRREVQRFRRFGRRGPGHQRVEREPDAFEVASSRVDAIDAAAHEQARVDQILQERHLLGASSTKLGHQTSFAIKSRPALLLWIRSLAIISGPDIVSRRWRPTLNGVSFLKPRIPHTSSAPRQTSTACSDAASLRLLTRSPAVSVERPSRSGVADSSRKSR